MPHLRRKTPHPGEEKADEQGREERPAGEPATSKRASVSPNLRLLEREGGDRVPLRTIVWPWLRATVVGATSLRGPLPSLVEEALAVGRVGDEERPDDLGEERTLGLVEAAEDAAGEPEPLRGEVRVVSSSDSSWSRIRAPPLGRPASGPGAS